MRKWRHLAGSSITMLLFTMPFSFAAGRGGGQGATEQAQQTVACRVMEVKASERFGVSLVIFHHRVTADRQRLGTLLREHDGAAVDFQARDVQWRPGTVFRLKTCFGRGLLVCSGASARLARGDDFALRFRTSSRK